MPIRRRHRSGSDRLRRHLRPPDPDRHARRATPAGSPRPRSDPNAVVSHCHRDRHADTTYKHAHCHTGSAHEHTGAYCYDVTHTDRDTSTPYQHANANSYSCADGYSHAVPYTNRHASTPYQHADTSPTYQHSLAHLNCYSSSAHQHPYPHYEGGRSRTPGRVTPVVRGAFH